jgi:hypothetical protein
MATAKVNRNRAFRRLDLDTRTITPSPNGLSGQIGRGKG